MENKNLFIQKTSIERFIFAIENKMYVKAHELLEDDWREYKNIYRQTNIEKFRTQAKAVQGLINGATALALYFEKKRPNSYKKIWKVFEKHAPLLDEINLENMNKYYEAKDTLLKINKTIPKDIRSNN